MKPLHPRVVTVWHFAGLIAAFIVTAAVGAFEHWILGRAAVKLLMPGLLTAGVGGVGVAFALLWPRIRYRLWRWEVRPDRVVIQKGVIWRSRSLIPRVRIQHVDTHTSPLQRWLGLASLVIYTAGTRGADAEIPGLAVEEAEALREELARLEELDEKP